MLRPGFRTLALALSVLLTACPPEPSGNDAGRDARTGDAVVSDIATTPDVTEPMDSSMGDDAGVPDAAMDAAATDSSDDTDADATGDAATDARRDPNDILGTLSGPCGTLNTMLRTPTPSLVQNALVFMPPEQYVESALSPDGQRMFNTPNAGGSSLESEVMSLEVLHFCEGASLEGTETEIMYAPPDDSGPNTITDILVKINGDFLGVSVARAYRPDLPAYTDDAARTLLMDKLNGINRSSMRVRPAGLWMKQILHIFAVNQAAADAINRVWPTLDASVRSNTIVLVTVTQGGGFIYCNPDPALGSECPPIR